MSAESLDALTQKYDVGNQARRAYTGLRSAILTGVFRPGDQLPERALSEQLGVSRTPLRDALTRLSSEGITEHVPNVGCFVRKVSDTERNHIMEVRQVLEAGAAALAAEKACEEDRRLLITQARDIDDAVREGQTQEIGDVETRFHRRIVELSRNPDLLDMFESHKDLFHLTFAAVGHVPSRRASEHVPLAEAIASGDPARAHTAMWLHLGESLKDWRQRTEQAPEN